MQIQLIQGQFSQRDAMALINDLIRTKIKFHESRIEVDASEEDIKSREAKIIFLQNQLHTMRLQFNNLDQEININASIEIE